MYEICIWNTRVSLDDKEEVCNHYFVTSNTTDNVLFSFDFIYAWMGFNLEVFKPKTDTNVCFGTHTFLRN